MYILILIPAILFGNFAALQPYTPPEPITKANYVGGQYDEKGQSARGYPYNAPYGGSGAGATGTGAL